MSTTSIPRLWVAPGACSLACHITFRETGADFALNIIDVMKAFPKEHLKINPKGRVPFLELADGNLVTELPAICLYISNLAPKKQLLGTTDMEVVRTFEWFNYISGTVHSQGFGGLFRPTRFSDDEAQYESIREKSRETIQDCFDYIEGKLKGVHAVGDSFTAVDAFLFTIWRWAKESDFDMSRYPKFAKLVESVARRESVLTALEKEGIALSRWGSHL